MARWKPKPVGVASEGLYVAKVISTKFIGETVTYGRKRGDVQEFVFRVRDKGKRRDIHIQFPMTMDERSNFYALLVALGLDLEKVMEDGVDPDTFVGKKVNVRVFHTHGGKFANVKCLPPTPKLAESDDEPEPEPIPELTPEPKSEEPKFEPYRGCCEYGDCTNERRPDSTFCDRHFRGICDYGNCKNNRASDGGKFCTEHTWQADGSEV
jgi:hypothetical protein